MDTYFGEHLTIDGYGGSEESLNNKEAVFSCLNELPEKLGMHKLSTPEVYHADANDIKDPGGWTGWA
jgi:S-adenosylmethionine/arginine decarboxylase-like enzyme